MSQKTLHSYHIFLFPFKWEIYQGEKHDESAIDARYQLKEIPIDVSYWKPFTFEALPDNEGFHSYNEYTYFYEQVRDVLNVDNTVDTIHLKQFVYQGLNSSSSFSIKAKGSTYTLSLENIVANFYENGVGVLSLFLRNTEYHDKKDIFKINDFGRRIYPQYLGENEPFTSAPNGTKDNFLAQEIKLSGIQSWLDSEVSEDFSHYDTQEGISRNLFVLPKYFKALLGPAFCEPTKNASKGTMFISPVIDDRMFTLCIYYNQDFINQLALRNIANDGYEYLSNSDWYQMVFVDGSYPSCHSPEMMKEQLQKVTYSRWLVPYTFGKNGDSWGQVFGISRYSFVVVAAPNDFNLNVIQKHITHHYFQMVMLSLIQRAYLVNFSNEVARISRHLNNDNNLFGKNVSEISILYRQYIKFVNRIFFREITPQEQGIELYDKLQEHMRIREEVKDLDQQINELNTYAETQQQNRLTLIASWFAVPSLLATIIGLNPFWNDKDKWHWWWFEQIGGEWNSIVAIILVIISLFASNYVLKLLAKNKRKK